MKYADTVNKGQRTLYDAYKGKVKRIQYKAQTLFGWRHKPRWFYFQLTGFEVGRSIIQWTIEWFLTLKETDYKSFEYFWFEFERLVKGNDDKLSLIERFEVDFINLKASLQTD